MRCVSCFIFCREMSFQLGKQCPISTNNFLLIKLWLYLVQSICPFLLNLSSVICVLSSALPRKVYQPYIRQTKNLDHHKSKHMLHNTNNQFILYRSKFCLPHCNTANVIRTVSNNPRYFIGQSFNKINKISRKSKYGAVNRSALWHCHWQSYSLETYF